VAGRFCEVGKLAVELRVRRSRVGCRKCRCPVWSAAEKAAAVFLSPCRHCFNFKFAALIGSFGIAADAEVEKAGGDFRFYLVVGSFDNCAFYIEGGDMADGGAGGLDTDGDYFV